ncbi:MAG: FAD-binding protein [Pseudolabrys sp.]|jgi:tricarballylate dehydrogenase
MTNGSGQLVVVGQGAAGLAAALSAAETAAVAGQAVRITLVDKAPETEAGGNTRWSPSYTRMAAPDRVEPTFIEDMLAATQFKGDRRYFTRLAQEAPATIKWVAAHNIEFIQPTYYLAKGPPRIQPRGGGPTLISELSRAAKKAEVEFLYGYTAKTLLTENGQITGLKIARDNTHEILTADAVILATGGFQANGEMMRQHLGPKAEMMRLISPGTCFNTGDGIRMAFEIGATGAGDWSGMHAEPVDARSKSSAPVVLVYPYGVVVDQNGCRFFDEGGGLVHETWEWFARNIHFKTPNSIAYAILDSRFLEISDYQRAIRSEIPPVRGDTLADLAKLLGVNGANLEQTIATYNVSCTGDLASFDATRCDGLVASNDLHPPKSNWARAIEVPPFFGYPLVGAIAYTFGGLATDEHARVMRAGTPIPGLYAAGEITGHFYATAPNAVSILRALVFGRIAGREAVANLRPK